MVNAPKKHPLTALFLATLLTSGTYAANVEDIDADDDGLIEIETLAELNLMREDLNGASLNGNTAGCPETGCIGYELMNDLDFDTNGDGVLNENDTYWNDGAGWNPIGDSENSFYATFDGNNHRISNLFINRSDDTGFFGVIANAKIQNLILDGDLARVTGSMFFSNTGALIGSIQNQHNSDYTDRDDTYIQNIRSSVNVFAEGEIGEALISNIGGLIGTTGLNAAYRVHLNDIAVTADITITETAPEDEPDKTIDTEDNEDMDVGGIIGNGSLLTATALYYEGSITATSDHVGGLFGYLNSTSEVTESAVHADISAPYSDYVGGITGKFGTVDDNSQIMNTYSTGSIIGNESIAGIVGATLSSQVVQNVYSTMTITGNGEVAALVATDADNSRFVDANEVIIEGSSYYSTTANPNISSENAIGVTEAQLACPTAANNESCAEDTTLYSGWSDAVWSFGTTTQLPTLVAIENDDYDLQPASENTSNSAGSSSSSGGALPLWLCAAIVLLLGKRRSSIQ